MHGILILALTTYIIGVEPASTDGKIAEYFHSDVFKAFQKQWQTHRKSFENAILLALKENYGSKGMNVYVRRTADGLQISNGFYVTDNIVDLLLSDLTLTSLPHLVMPEVTFALASNVLLLEAGLSKMIVKSRYHLFRNQSDVIVTAAQDPYENSPFAYEEVDNVGQLVIVADDCTLVGFVIAKLSSQSVNLGHATFQVRDCKFSVEISPHHHGRQPVIAPYFSKNQGKQLEMLLTKPIREELFPKLQAAVFTYINTSLIFGEHLTKFREYQENIFMETLKNISSLVRNINNLTIDLEDEISDLEPIEVTWNFTSQGRSYWSYIFLYNATLHGLDTLYSSQTGGPFKLQTPSIVEALRFNSLVVRGSLVYKNNTFSGEYDFVAEIKDVTVNLEIDLTKYKPAFKFLNWRKLELSAFDLKHHLNDRRAAGAFVSGYLTNKIPLVLEEHLLRVYRESDNSNDVKPDKQKLHNANVNCMNAGDSSAKFPNPFESWFGCGTC